MIRFDAVTAGGVVTIRGAVLIPITIELPVTNGGAVPNRWIHDIYIVFQDINL